MAALINVDDLADLEDRAALAAHLADNPAGHGGIGLDELDAALGPGRVVFADGAAGSAWVYARHQLLT